MKFVKLTAAAALVAASLSASAMSSINDDELSAVSGQDGVTIAGDLNINIGSFRYTDTDTTGGSVSFDGIGISGMFVMTIDILNSTAFNTAVINGMTAHLAAAGDANAAADAATNAAKLVTAGVYGTGVTGPLTGSFQDVVQFAFPAAGLDSRLAPSITVNAIKMGSTSGATGVQTADSSPSFGSMAINNIDMQGTKIWIYAH
jgi:hypothetical protein